MIRYVIEGTTDTSGSGWSADAVGNTDNCFATEEDAEEARQQLIAYVPEFTEDNTRVSEHERPDLDPDED